MRWFVLTVLPHDHKVAAAAPGIALMLARSSVSARVASMSEAFSWPAASDPPWHLLSARATLRADMKALALCVAGGSVGDGNPRRNLTFTRGTCLILAVTFMAELKVLHVVLAQ